MRRQLRVSFLGISLILFSMAGESHAASTDADGAGQPLLQLTAFMAPVRKLNGRVITIPVTPILELSDARTAEEVCWMTPRIMDAFIGILHSEPIPSLTREDLDLGKMEQRLTDAVNAALGRRMVIRLNLVPLARSAKANLAGSPAASKCGI